MSKELVPADEAQTAEIRGILQRAHSGDRSVLPQLNAILDDNTEVWEKAGDLAFLAENALFDRIARADLVVQESLRRRLTKLKADLGGPSPTALEKLLVDRVCLEWLFLHLADVGFLDANPYELTGCIDEKKRDFAHRRFVRSIKMLATVRKLLRPKAPPIDFTLVLTDNHDGDNTRARNESICLS